MNPLFSLVFLLVALAAWSKAERLYVRDKLIRLEPITDGQIEYLRALELNSTLDFWTEIVSISKPVDVHIQANVYEQFISQFKQLSIPFKVLADDLQQVIDDEQQQLAQERLVRELRSRQLGRNQADIVGTYASYDEMIAFLQDKSNADPTRATMLDLGSTYQGRRLKGISLQYNASSGRNIWIDCGIHAREWITPAVCIYLVDKLIADYNNNDAAVQDLLNYWNVYIAPSLNPDGYEFSRTSGNRLWRKNRAVNSGSTCIGVDLNRNYPWKWMTGGSSNNPCSDTFAGRSAGSEIETDNVVSLLLSKIGTWDMYMSFHSYGQWWFTPYGYTTNLPADYNKQFAFAQTGANAIQAVNNRKYDLGSVARLLYIASGSTVDWAYDVLKCRFSYTIELPPSSSEASTGFVLPPGLAPGVCNETYIGMKAFLAEVKKEVQASSTG